MTDQIAIRVPGRVNLIGEHTDYNDGFVLPVAVDLFLVLAGRPRPGMAVRLESLAFGGAAEIGIGADPSTVEPAWARPAAGAIAGLAAEGLRIAGFEARVEGDLPVGAGLSSSAALTVAVALAAIRAARLAGAEVPAGLEDGRRLAAICRDAEAAAAGVRCGIMDPYTVLLAAAGAALLLDCRSVTHRAVPIDPARLALVVADTGVRHALADGAYNRRRESCESAVRRLGLRSLRDLDPAALAPALEALPDEEARRVRHVVTENERTLRAAECLESGDLRGFGALLLESHESLRADYEVSCPELDALVTAARAVPGVLGSRMTGGGFGGCTVTAVRPDGVPRLREALAGRAVSAVRVAPTDGALLAS